MQMRVSVVIPTLDEADRIGSAIVALHAAGFEEIIISDGASTDGTESVARAAGAVVVDAPRGRGKQLQHGAAAATGDLLFFLHADSSPPEGARAMIAETLSAPGAVAGCFTLAFDRTHPLLSFYSVMSRINHNLFTYGDQGLFMARAAFDRIGGYSDAPLFEDVDIVRRARRAGRFVKRPEAVITSARRFARDGPALRELTNVGLVVAYHAGVSPERLANWYRAERKFRE